MKLYDYPLAFNPAKARLIFSEKAKPHATELVNLFTGAGVSPRFMRINPQGSVPVLVDGDKVITESRAIIDYVDNIDGAPLGGKAVDRAFISKWLDQVNAWDGNLFIAAHGPGAASALLGPLQAHTKKVAEAQMQRNPDLAQVYSKKLESMKKNAEAPKDPQVSSQNLRDLVSLLDTAEQRLAKAPYVAGDEYSAADVIFTPVLYRIFLAGKGDELMKPRPNVSAYYERLKQRPSYKEVFGPQENPLYAGSLVVPALFQAVFSKIFNSY